MLLPGAILDPGAHWNYQAGVSSCLMDVWHYTVGANSIGICRDNGLVAFLVREEGIYQFSPSDAVNFTQCEWNRVATATEVESIDGWISPVQLDHLRYLTLWKLTQHGIPPVFYDGPRMPILNGYQGVTNHRNLVHVACDQHGDGFDQWVWDYVWAPPAQAPGDTMASFLIAQVGGPDNGKVFILDMDANTKSWVHNPDALNAAISIRNVVRYFGGWADSTLHASTDDDGLWGKLLADARDLDAQDDVSSGGGVGGASVGEIETIVQDSEERIRADVNRPRTVQ